MTSENGTRTVPRVDHTPASPGDEDADWPHTCRPSWPWTVFMTLLALTPFGMGPLLWFGSPRKGGGSVPSDWLEIVELASPFALVGLGLLWGVATEKIVLTRETIRYRGRTLARADIRGRRYRGKLIFVPREGAKKLTIYPEYYAREPALERWLLSIPDLDAQDRDAAVAALLASPRFGASEDARRATWERARRVTWTLNGLTAALCAWGLFRPVPYGAVTVALSLLPCVALGLLVWGGGRYAFVEKHDEVRPLLLFPLLCPQIGLALLALKAPFGVVDCLLLTVASSLVGLVVGYVLLLQEPARRAWFSAVIVSAAFALNVGLMASNANILLDTRSAQALRVAILESPPYDKRIRLAPWGPYRRAELFSVGARTRERLRGQAQACVVLHPGALGARWFVIDACR